MKTSFFRFIVLIIRVYFYYPVIAQDKKSDMRDSSGSLRTGDSLFLKDSSGIKKDTAKKRLLPADSTAPTPSHLELNVTWESNDVNNGRKDSTVIPLITPEISYIFKSGFEIDLSVGYNTHEASPQVNQYTLDGSYSLIREIIVGPLRFRGLFTVKIVEAPRPKQKGSLESDNSYDFPFIQPGLNLTWTFGTIPSDFQASFSLQHQFSIGNLNITPTATMNAATQNSYNAYYMNRRFSIPRNGGKPPLPANVTLSGQVLNANEFQILDYELSSPVSYTAGNWTFNFTPTYALPVNPADILLKVQVDNNTHFHI